MREGDEIVFTEVGNVGQNQIQGDIIFRIKEIPHPRFNRDGNNLTMKTKLTLGQALLGTIIPIVYFFSIFF